eukprot:11978666-Prorocentrum_lima.AAC.1
MAVEHEVINAEYSVADHVSPFEVLGSHEHNAAVANTLREAETCLMKQRKGHCRPRGESPGRTQRRVSSATSNGPI